MNNQSKEYMKYENGRKCRNCDEPIADHVHAHTQFCEKRTLPDGSIQSCKDDYHAEKNRIENQPFIDLMNFHKTMTRNIARLFEDKGASVTIADVDFYQIGLAWAVFTEPFPDLKMAYYYIKFKLTLINKTQIQITTHEIKFQ